MYVLSSRLYTVLSFAFSSQYFGKEVVLCDISSNQMQQHTTGSKTEEGGKKPKESSSNNSEFCLHLERVFIVQRNTEMANNLNHQLVKYVWQTIRLNRAAANFEIENSPLNFELPGSCHLFSCQV